MHTQRYRWFTGAGLFAVALISVLQWTLPDEAARILLDRFSTMPPYPFTVQNALWMVFFLGLGETGFQAAGAKFDFSKLISFIAYTDQPPSQKAGELSVPEGGFTERSDIRSLLVLEMFVREAKDFLQPYKNGANNSARIEEPVRLMAAFGNQKDFLGFLIRAIPVLAFIGAMLDLITGLAFAVASVSDGGALDKDAAFGALWSAFDGIFLGAVLGLWLVFFSAAIKFRDRLMNVMDCV